MKKKILIVLMILTLLFTILLMATACKKPTPDDGDKEKDPGKSELPIPGEETDFTTFGNNLLASMENLIISTVNLEDKMHGKAQLFVELNGDKLIVDIEATFDAKVPANNKAYFSVSVREKDATVANPYFSIYTQDDVIYIGEALTQVDFEWMKLSQAADSKLISYYFAKLPGLLPNDLTGDNGLLKPGSIATPAFGNATVNDMFPLLMKPNVLVSAEGYDSTQSIDGTYYAKIDLARVSSILTVLKSLGIEDLINGLGEDITTLLNMVAQVVFNQSLDQLFGKAEVPTDLVVPEVVISYKVEDTKLSAIDLKYENSKFTFMGSDPIAVSVAFGLKDIKTDADVTTSFKPASLTLASVKETYIKLNVNVELPQLDAGTTLNLDVFINPAIGFTLEESGDDKYPVVDFSNIEGWAHGTITVGKGDAQKTYDVYGQYIYDKDLKTGKLAVDLTGLAGYAGITEPEYSLKYYYLDIDIFEAIFGVSSDPTNRAGTVDDPKNSEAGSDTETPDAKDEEVKLSAFDKLIKMFKDGGSLDMMTLLTTALDVGTTNLLPALDKVGEKVVTNETDDTASLALADVLDLIEKDDTFKFLRESTYFGADIMRYVADPVDMILDALNSGAESEDLIIKGEIYAVLQAFTGADFGLEVSADLKDEEKLKIGDAIINSLVAKFGVLRPQTSAVGGIGFTFAVLAEVDSESAGVETLIKVSVSVDVLGGDWDALMEAHNYKDIQKTLDKEDGKNYDLAQEAARADILELLGDVIDGTFEVIEAEKDTTQDESGEEDSQDETGGQ
ncbi:MAG: hypothetical protein LBE09_01245 [Christensenellaceae bacterium]|nr:hypothetical protein [Christensenellaceae bacterium]